MALQCVGHHIISLPVYHSPVKIQALTNGQLYARVEMSYYAWILADN